MANSSNVIHGEADRAEAWQAGRPPLTRACLREHRAKRRGPRLALGSPGGVAGGVVQRLDGFRIDLESGTGHRGSVAYGVGGRMFHLRCKPTKADHRQTTLDNYHLLRQVGATHLASFLVLDWVDLLACCDCSWSSLSLGSPELFGRMPKHNRRRLQVVEELSSK